MHTHLCAYTCEYNTRTQKYRHPRGISHNYINELENELHKTIIINILILNMYYHYSTLKQSSAEKQKRVFGESQIILRPVLSSSLKFIGRFGLTYAAAEYSCLVGSYLIVRLIISCAIGHPFFSYFMTSAELEA